ncbi:MAG: hypothetical protein GYA50_06585 [Eubacteriaceae bacterium]|nr:hypothetical protein [Eubacteriaceae bacterium]
MKFKKFALFLIIFALIMAFLPVNALAATSYTMSGTSTVRNGDTISVSFTLNSLSNAKGVEARITYSNSYLTYISASSGISGWNFGASKYSSDTVKILLYNSSGAVLSGTKTICTLKFKVTGTAGNKINVNPSYIEIPTSSSTIHPSGSAYSKTIAAPLSTNANLASLSVSNAKVYPSFSSSITSYKTTVGADISSLSISAKAADSGAKVSISNNSLKSGATTSVKITVKAAAGNTKTYTIAATRPQDPNYVAGTNNYLKSISLNVGILSPTFNKDVTSYVVWLPNEITSITASGVAEDAKASVTVVGGESLIEGDNQVSVICAAESGAEKEYKIIVKRASSGQQTGPADITSVLSKFESMSTGDVNIKTNILLDLSASASKQIPASLFEELKKYPNTTLTINLGNAKIVFKGSDITADITSEYYDLSFVLNSDYADLIRGKAGDENGIIFSYTYEGNLPGYAVFYLMTNLDEGSTYNLYKYSLEEDKFYLIAKNVVVGQAGVLPYVNNTCSEYILTKNTIEGAVVYDSASKQGALNSGLAEYKDDLAAILILVMAAAIGFALGIVFNKSLRKRAQKVINEIVLDDSEIAIENLHMLPINNENKDKSQVYSEDINQSDANSDNKTQEVKFYAEDVAGTQAEETAEDNKKQEETV